MTGSDALGAFIEITYDETLVLLVDTRDFISALPGASEPGAPDPSGRSDTISAISGLTWRMTELMSWLLLQKAIITGEIGLDEAASQPSFKLPDIAIDDTSHNGPDVDLPVAVRGLIDRGRRVGDRAIKLQGSLDSARG